MKQVECLNFLRKSLKTYVAGYFLTNVYLSFELYVFSLKHKISLANSL